jgi:hypothetical protein
MRKRIHDPLRGVLEYVTKSGESSQMLQSGYHSKTLKRISFLCVFG